MKSPLNPDEQVLRAGRANLQRGIETVGGKLYLTNTRLQFEAHRGNVQAKAATVPLSDIASMTPAWTKFLGFIPLAANSLAVVTTTGEEFRFVLSGRRKWASAIDAARSRVGQ